MDQGTKDWGPMGIQLFLEFHTSQYSILVTHGIGENGYRNHLCIENNGLQSSDCCSRYCMCRYGKAEYD